MKADHAVQIAVIQGPNLNRLGVRRPERYGTETLADVTSRLDGLAARLGVELQHIQSNREGELIDWLHERMDVDAVIVNPAGLTQYGRPLLDSVSDVGKPVAVVHIAQLHRHHGTGTHGTFKAIADVYVCGPGRWAMPPRSCGSSRSFAARKPRSPRRSTGSSATDRGAGLPLNAPPILALTTR